MSVAYDLETLLAPLPDERPAQSPRARLHVVPRVPGEALHARVEESPRPVAGASVSVLHAPSGAALPLRLTRRGVLVLALLTSALAAVLVWAAAASAPDASASGAVAAGPATVTVRAGDTLWAVANRVAPQRDPRAEVAQLRRLNHLADPDLVPGQVLRVR
ncbi:LysM peptidoglycan-binding domain-containing protein [uncultured Jatrophihabitans sp.]|uniref:LysM peptidoglycan-binding domain-containing protein n=1 Tax=uncultured Jatrophihabitans sp. TaxID=1610747 RepID=UPI0035CB4FDA